MGWSALSLLMLCIVSIGQSQLDQDVMGFNEMNENFAQFFVDNIIDSGVFGTAEDKDFSEVIETLMKAIAMFTKLHFVPPSQKKTLMTAFASELAELIISERDDTMSIVEKTNALTGALRHAYRETGVIPNENFIQEVDFMVGILLTTNDEEDYELMEETSDQILSRSPQLQPEPTLAIDPPRLTPRLAIDPPRPMPRLAIDPPRPMPRLAIDPPRMTPRLAIDPPRPMPRLAIDPPRPTLAISPPKPEPNLPEPFLAIDPPKPEPTLPEPFLAIDPPKPEPTLPEPFLAIDPPKPEPTLSEPFLAIDPPKPEPTLPEPFLAIDSPKPEPTLPEPFLAIDPPKPETRPATTGPLGLSPFDAMGISEIENVFNAVLRDSQLFIPLIIKSLLKSKSTAPNTIDLRTLKIQLQAILSDMQMDQFYLSKPELFLELILETLISSLEIIRATDYSCIKNPSTFKNAYKYINAFNDLLF